MTDREATQNQWDLKVRDALSETYDVLSSGSISELRSMAEDYRIQALLIAIHPPHGKGYEWIERLREDDLWEDCPILAVVPQPNPATREILFRLGADELIGHDDDLATLNELTDKLIADVEFVHQLRESIQNRNKDCEVIIENTEIKA